MNSSINDKAKPPPAELEISILPLSQVKEGNRDTRIDSRYFSRAALLADARIAMRDPEPISEITSDVRSFGAYALTNEFEYQDEGIPFLRGTNYSGDFINFADVLRISPEAHKLLHKSEVIPGMVLLSMSGSVGSVAVALESWQYPINSNQDIAKIVPERVDPFYLAAFLAGSYGRAQIERLPVGSVQQHIFLWMIERIQVPRFELQLEAAVAQRAKLAYETHEAVSDDLANAEQILLSGIGLSNWIPPEPLTYTANASSVLAAHRFDARFFAPRIQELLNILGRDNKRILDIAQPRNERFDPGSCATFHYIEIGDMDGAGEVTSNILNSAEAPSRATSIVREGDIITSTVRPIRRLTAQISPQQDGYVCSSGFVVIRPHAIEPELLLTYLRLPAICELLDLYASASMYPAVADAHIFGLPIPLISKATEVEVVSRVRKAKAAKSIATELLTSAKRAVEIAIDAGEEAGLNYLNSAKGT